MVENNKKINTHEKIIEILVLIIYVITQIQFKIFYINIYIITIFVGNHHFILSKIKFVFIYSLLCA